MSGRVCASILHRASPSHVFAVSSQAHQNLLASSQQLQTQHSHCSTRGGLTLDHQCCSGLQTGFWSHCRRRLSTRQDRNFQLSQVQISSILRANEQAVSVAEFDGRGLSVVRKFESNRIAANTPNEDRHSAATCLQTNGMLFGVFDGHGGWACAQAISERLLYYVAVAMMPQRGLEVLERCMEHGRPVPPILQWHKHRGEFSYRESASLYVEHLRIFWQELLYTGEHGDGMGPQDALDYAFKRLDADICLEAQAPLSSDLMRSTAIQVAFSGCTACVAHVGRDGIHVANAGDCRAVLGVQEADGSWSALPLSSDHNYQNQRELDRIRAQHPPSERDTVVVEDRLLGALIPLRAFGDVRFKWSRELQQSVLEGLDSAVDLDSLNLYQYTPPNYLSPPYLDVAPELTHHKLRPQDRFLILASDGLWDELGNQEAVRLVGEHLSGIHLQAPITATQKRHLNLGEMHELLLKRQAQAIPALDLNAATHLIRHALGTGDYGEQCQERLATMLVLPDDLARMYRDDITAMVVYLNSDLAKAHHAVSNRRSMV